MFCVSADVLRALHKAVEYFTAMGRLSMAAKNLRASLPPPQKFAYAVALHMYSASQLDSEQPETMMAVESSSCGKLQLRKNRLGS